MDLPERVGETPTQVRVGLVGKGIQMSRTPAMHVAEGTAQGLSYRYDLIDPDAMSAGVDGAWGVGMGAGQSEPEPDAEPDLADLIAAAEAQGFAGVNVTYPYKKAVIEHLDELSDAARHVGAVNTVVFVDGKRRGHNTDVWGFAESLRAGLPDAKMDTILLLGAGGAGGALAHVLKTMVPLGGAKRLLIFDANPVAATALAEQVGGEAVTDLARAAADTDGIVNATPMGMAKLPGMAISADLIEPRHWVADIVYFPLETELLATAAAKGCAVLNGSGMAINQALRAFELFTGLKPEAAGMRAAFEAFTTS
jgi:shikimate dehydrogenase